MSPFYCYINTHAIIAHSEGSLICQGKKKCDESDTRSKQRNMKSKVRRWFHTSDFGRRGCDLRWNFVISFCSIACHWECEQQRAAWIHKYQTRRVHLSVIKGMHSFTSLGSQHTPLSSCLTAGWTTESWGLWSASTLSQDHTGDTVEEVGNKRIVEWQVIDQHQPSSR